MHDLSARFGWKRRLHSAASFKAVFADRRHPPIRTPAFTLYRRDNDHGHPRLGISVSRRAARKAVHRSRIKRRIRETFRQQHGLPSMDFVVTCAERVETKASPREISALLRRVWRKLADPENRRG